MRLISKLLALGAIAWVLVNASGKGPDQGVVPESHQEPINKAQALEQSLEDAAQDKIKALGQ